MPNLQVSRSIHWVFRRSGSLSVAIGFIGMLVALVPTTPSFMVLAALLLFVRPLVL